MIVFLVGVRDSVFFSHLLETICKNRYPAIKIWLQLLISIIPKGDRIITS